MREIAEEFLLLPIPFLYVMLAGLLLWRKTPWGRRLLVCGAALLLVFSTEGVGKLLAVPLVASVAPAGARPAASLIVVPTGGVYRDPLGRWRSDPNSLSRLAAALRLRDEKGLPLLIVGGAPIPGQPVESEVLAREAGLLASEAAVETRAVNSWESGRAVAEALAGEPEKERRVILVTSALHMLRMAASLRRAGIAVVGVRVGGEGLAEFEGISDLVPGIRGIGLCRSVSREYMGILWYLIRGRIGLADLLA